MPRQWMNQLLMDETPLFKAIRAHMNEWCPRNGFSARTEPHVYVVTATSGHWFEVEHDGEVSHLGGLYPGCKTCEALELARVEVERVRNAHRTLTQLCPMAIPDPKTEEP